MAFSFGSRGRCKGKERVTRKLRRGGRDKGRIVLSWNWSSCDDEFGAWVVKKGVYRGSRES